MSKVHYKEKCLTLTLQFITDVGKLYSVESTLRGEVYDTDTTAYYCCR